MNFRSEDDSHEMEYIFVITRWKHELAEYTIIEFDNYDGEFDLDDAKLELEISMTKGWEFLGVFDDIIDGEDFINYCIDIDELITFTK